MSNTENPEKNGKVIPLLTLIISILTVYFSYTAAYRGPEIFDDYKEKKDTYNEALNLHSQACNLRLELLASSYTMSTPKKYPNIDVPIVIPTYLDDKPFQLSTAKGLSQETNDKIVPLNQTINSLVNILKKHKRPDGSQVAVINQGDDDYGIASSYVLQVSRDSLEFGKSIEKDEPKIKPSAGCR